MLSFCTFANNTAIDSTVISFDGNNAGTEIKQSNIIRNEHIEDSESYGLIESNGDLTIKDSCILENKAKCTFCQQESSNLITTDNCTLDDDVESKIGSYILITNKAQSLFVHSLVHLSTGYCAIKKKRRNFFQTRNVFWKMRLNVAVIQTMILNLAPSFLQ